MRLGGRLEPDGRDVLKHDGVREVRVLVDPLEKDVRLGIRDNTHEVLLGSHVHAKGEKHLDLGDGDDNELEPPAVAGVELLVVRLGFVGGPGRMAGIAWLSFLAPWW